MSRELGGGPFADFDLHKDPDTHVWRLPRDDRLRKGLLGLAWMVTSILAAALLAAAFLATFHIPTGAPS